MNRIPVSFGIALLALSAVAAGCSEQRVDAAADKSNAKSTARAATRTPTITRRAPMVIPAGTMVVASLDSPLTTETNMTGDVFHATTVDAIIVDGKTVVPAGSQIHGVLRDVQSSGRIKGRARMTLDFQQIEDANRVAHSISAQSLTLQAASETQGDVEKIAAGGVLGAIIGGVVDGKKGAVIGAGAGVGAGTILMLATKGDEVELGAGQRVNVAMTSSTNIDLASSN